MSYKFFKNTACEFYPCHNTDEINCMFCYCPLYPFWDCGGNFETIEANDGKMIKDCTGCVFPHIKENYDEVINRLSEHMRENR